MTPFTGHKFSPAPRQNFSPHFNLKPKTMTVDPRRGSELHQFPQPTRPKLSYDPDDQSPEKGSDQEYHQPGTLELPKPSRPKGVTGDEASNSGSGGGTRDIVYDAEPPEYYAQFLESTQNTVSAAGSSLEAPKGRFHLSPATGKTPKGEKEAVDELLLILVECMDELNTRSRELLLRKFFGEIEREERLEKFIVQRLRQSQVKAISELYEKIPERFHEGDDVLPAISEEFDDDLNIPTRSIYKSVEELSDKLERFKVKTLDLGEVKEEEEKKADESS